MISRTQVIEQSTKYCNIQYHIVLTISQVWVSSLTPALLECSQLESAGRRHGSMSDRDRLCVVLYVSSLLTAAQSTMQLLLSQHISVIEHTGDAVSTTFILIIIKHMDHIVTDICHCQCPGENKQSVLGSDKQISYMLQTHLPDAAVHRNHLFLDIMHKFPYVNSIYRFPGFAN